ncbi:hypothetical protein [Amycolatopsis sp. WQ 127309]|uniref:hypothetical protein n=1 Tax=Amycolatopsis sp. WQ 127309 TaxID=2932773 RepID=UPI001FF63AFB|nr:hypothetical protein [Amycolatopsis sp. WQ 127309]UOZ05679.1 hypothetical protein MUY22_43775 [Amycolatopsis sp. WQ 127309]
MKVYLRNHVTGAVVARAVTGSGGGFTFRDVPADLYDFGIVDLIGASHERVEFDDHAWRSHPP